MAPLAKCDSGTYDILDPRIADCSNWFEQCDVPGFNVFNCSADYTGEYTARYVKFFSNYFADFTKETIHDLCVISYE